MVQRPLFEPTATWKATAPSALPSWAGAKRISIDVETKDTTLTKLGPGVRREGYVVGYSFAIEDGPSHYVPIRHEASEDNVDPATALAYLRTEAAAFKGSIVGANLQYDLDYLAEEDVYFPEVEFFRDVQVAEPLIDELQTTYALDAIAARRGLPGKDESLLRRAAAAFDLDPKKDMWQLPARFVGAYAEQDAYLPLQIMRRQEREIDEQELWPIFDLESRVLPVLLKMRRRGIRIDHDQLDYVEQWALVHEAEALKELHRLTGVQVAVGDTMKPAPLAKALATIGVEVPLTPKTQQPSVKQDFLESIDHDVARVIVRARKVSKLRTTFVASIRRYETNGRIHCSLNQLRATKDDASDDERGTRYGRLSASDPNMQQQLARDPELGPMWRKVFLPDEGALWACCDYSQQEPRWVVHFAEKLNLPRAHEAAERYRNDPTTDIHTMMSQLMAGEGPDWRPTKQARDTYKQIFLGIIYGMGGGKLCRELGLPTEWVHSARTGGTIEVAGPEGKAILALFDERAPFLRQLAYRASDRAKAAGFVRTVGGRRCRFPVDASGHYDWTHKALNRVVQGSSADQMKTAMVMADDQGFELQLQVHDELDLSVADPSVAVGLSKVMINAIPANVPFTVDIEVGPSWGEIE